MYASLLAHKKSKWCIPAVRLTNGHFDKKGLKKQEQFIVIFAMRKQNSDLANWCCCYIGGCS